jgi:GDSL-like lipase/acylhydrolase family protein
VAHHIVLLGDSIFDNAPYIAGAPDVVTHLRAMLPPPWTATLCAVDGHATHHVAVQLSSAPRDASHFVMSVGGNDALSNIDTLERRVRTVAEALGLLAGRLRTFERDYRGAIESVLALQRPTTVCTIYNGDFPAAEAPILRAAIALFNDVILRVAFERRLDVIDLRMVCTKPEDYANPIEPSSRGGWKIASAICRGVGATPPDSREGIVLGC